MDADLDALFSALANGLRREILEVMVAARAARPRGMAISDIAAAIEVNRFTASHHLRCLRESGLVVEHVSGRTRLQRLDLRAFLVLGDWLMPFFVDMSGQRWNPLTEFEREKGEAW
ncbi:ArsR/SmtB family transcription factor [Microbacterium sp. GXF7504]